MKKALLTIAVTAVAVASTYAQGLVVFNNGSGTKISTNSAPGGAATGVTAAAGTGSFYYALFYSATAVDVGGSTAAVAPSASALGTYVFNAANSSSWTLVTTLGTNSTAGRFLSSAPDVNGNTTVNGLAAGSTGDFVVLGWSANLGNTVAALQASLPTATSGFIGESVVSGGLTAGNGVSIPASATFGSGSPFIQGFTIGQLPVVPEPTTLALAGLGGASLLLFRRRK